MKNIDEKRNYFIKDIDQNELMNNKHKKVSMTIIYIKHFLILTSGVTGCILITAFASFLGFL